jgi:FixJ family two-component response regulator
MSPGGVTMFVMDDDVSARRGLARLLRSAGLEPRVYARKVQCSTMISGVANT